MDSFEIVAADATFFDALEYLSTLTFPATRYVFLSIENATAVVNNQRHGSNFGSAKYFALKLDTRAARVVNREPIISPRSGTKERTDYEARMFELYGPDGNLVRSVACANDGGRWDFQTYGDAHPIESTFNYAARRKRDRLTTENLQTLIESYGLPWLSPSRFVEAGRYVLVKKWHKGPDEWQRQIAESACTIEQADDPAYHW